MTEPTAEQVGEAAQTAVHTFLKSFGDEHLSTNKFFIIAESIDGNGVRGLWVANGADQARWESLGMLAYATEALDMEDDLGEEE